ncbi:ribosyl nicotinamide transporter [Lactiplantibacillus garii]|uniref:Ribosyl nicotinamide transporter n=1 Tax=Lactiplantibacillus garii TaxID=2306423 RepID=A0A3R8KKZ5_9LACO|nr:nicotinamide riboside transporter PnuC [Lactiplantibacillus garii]RRK11895.1 ribosyl nicotinamide transporter [Lactiplantibacillus garii]
MNNSAKQDSNVTTQQLVTNFKTDLRGLPAATKAVFNVKRNVTELRTLQPATKLMMSLMLLANIVGFVLGRDFSVNGWIGLITGLAVVLNLILVDQGRLTNYSWGILGCAVWLIIAINNRLIGDIASQTFYLIMQFVGIAVWHRKINEQSDTHELASRSFSKLSGVCWLITTIIIYLIVLYFSKRLNGTQIYLDATLLPLGIVGMVLMVYGYRSQWYAWIALDVINVIIWFNQLKGFSPASASMFALQLVMLANGLYGAYLWFYGQSRASTSN